MSIEIWQIVGLCVCSAILSVMLKGYRAEYAFMIGMVCTAAVMFMMAPKILEIINQANNLALKSGLEISFFEPVIKVMGVAYISQMGAELCRDSGENAIATKIELAGKVIICAMALPIVSGLFDVITNIM